MNKQEISTFIKLYVKFQKQCKHIAEILSEYNCNFKESGDSIWRIDYADDYAENKFNCYTEIAIYAMDCWIKSCTLFFPVELITANDEQIHEYAQEKYKK